MFLHKKNFCKNTLMLDTGCYLLDLLLLVSRTPQTQLTNQLNQRFKQIALARMDHSLGTSIVTVAV